MHFENDGEFTVKIVFAKLNTKMARKVFENIITTDFVPYAVIKADNLSLFEEISQNFTKKQYVPFIVTSSLFGWRHPKAPELAAYQNFIEDHDENKGFHLYNSY